MIQIHTHQSEFSHPQLHTKFEANLLYIVRLCLKTTTHFTEPSRHHTLLVLRKLRKDDYISRFATHQEDSRPAWTIKTQETKQTQSLEVKNNLIAFLESQEVFVRAEHEVREEA